MAERIITPGQQVANLRQFIHERESELTHRGLLPPEVMDLVRSEIRLYDLEQRVERGEVETVRYHECDSACPEDCSERDDA